MESSGEPGFEITFGQATFDDVEELVRLVQSAYRGESSRQGWTTEADLLEGQRVDAEMVREAVERERGMVLTARADGRLVGCCELEHRSETNQAYLGMFAVSPELQAAGVGRRVLGEAERLARDRWSADQLLITVIDVREELIRWYERRGFVRTGATLPFPYGDPRFGVPLQEDLRFVELVKVI